MENIKKYSIINDMNNNQITIFNPIISGIVIKKKKK